MNFFSTIFVKIFILGMYFFFIYIIKVTQQITNYTFFTAGIFLSANGNDILPISKLLIAANMQAKSRSNLCYNKALECDNKFHSNLDNEAKFAYRASKMCDIAHQHKECTIEVSNSGCTIPALNRIKQFAKDYCSNSKIS